MDQREKSMIMLKSLYIIGSVKVMAADGKPTYILEGVVGFFLVKDRRPQGTTLLEFKDILTIII